MTVHVVYRNFEISAESRVDGYSTSEDDDNDASETDRLYPSPDGKGADTSKPIPVEDLWNYIKEKKATNSLKQEEYEVWKMKENKY